MPTTHRLIVMRHAKSAWPAGVPDHDRPLAGRGRREAGLAGDWLRGHAGPIDLVVCSTATRARQTAKRVTKRLDATPGLRLDERVYAGSDRGLLGVLRELPESAGTVLLVGHNPGVEELVAELTGVWRQLLTSTIVVLSSRSAWADVGSRWGTLGPVVTPR